MNSTKQEKINIIFSSYREDFASLFHKFKEHGIGSIHFVTSRILFNILPKIMADINRAGAVDGYNTKTIVTDSIIATMDSLYEDKDISTHISEDVWAENVKRGLYELIPANIDMMYSIDSGDIKLHRTKGCVIL